MAMAQSVFTLLIAEDDEDDRLLIRDALEEVGFEALILFFEDGQKLLDHIKTNPIRFKEGAGGPCLIILDLNMPRKGGMEVLEELREFEGTSRVPVLVFTTSTERDTMLESYRLGATSFLNKPNSYWRMVKMMRSLKDYWMRASLLPQQGVQHDRLSLVEWSGPRAASTGRRSKG